MQQENSEEFTEANGRLESETKNFEERFNIFRKKYDQLKEKNRRLAMEKEELEETSQRYDKRIHWSDWGKRYLWKIVFALLLAVISNYKEKVVEEVYSQNRLYKEKVVEDIYSQNRLYKEKVVEDVYSQNRLISKNIEKHDTHNKLDDQEEERACKIVEQEQLHKRLCLKDNPYAVAMKDTTCDLDFSECMLNNLTFDLIIFQYSLNFSGSNLVNTTFETCHFHKRSTYSFDRADLRNCTFKHCLGGNNFGWSREELMKMVREKRVTFDKVKNFDEAVFENDIKKLIKEMYHL